MTPPSVPGGGAFRSAWLLGCALLALACVASCGELKFGDNDPPGPGSGGVDDDDDGPSQGDCCSAHDDPSCGNPIVSSCVCREDPTCCEQTWDASCAEKVTSLGCGLCDAAGSCCDASDEPGCMNPAVQDCVCGVDPFCCADGWDDQCVADVFLFECGACPGVSPCCVADGSPGCDDVSVQQCVCAQEEQCCLDGWDFHCVQQVSALGCGTCDRPASSSSSTASSSTSSGSGGQAPDASTGRGPSSTGVVGSLAPSRATAH